MAGETGDCISFQAELLPTGSISFGRFELESLSWERRSSFSHNRYLEEVEKYSTPGSVNQKRAILEAHFRKKPLVPQASFENQSTEECRSPEDHRDHEAHCYDEFEDRDDGNQPEFSRSDETPDGIFEHEVVECEDQETWPSEVPTKSVLCSDEKIVDPTYERSDHDEKDQAEHDSVTSNNHDLCMVADQEPDNKAVIVEELLEKKETVTVVEILQNKEAIAVEQFKSNGSSCIPAIDKKRAPILKKKIQKSPRKMIEAVEQKAAKIKRTDRMPIQQNMRKSPAERSYVSSGKMLLRSMGKLEQESTLKTKSLKQLPLRTPTPKSSAPKTDKVEASVYMKAKISQGNNKRNEVNGKEDIRAKKGGVASYAVSARSEVDAHRPLSRSKLVADSAKEETKQTGAVFSFKSDERAEKRKEYYMKLEEKLHAKEVEMNEIQAKTQEETEAALKQLRRSLNFKATPMPSFYHEAVPRGTEGKKNIATTPAKPQKLQNKCTTPRSRTSPREKSPSLPKASNCENPSGNESNSSSSVKEKRKKDERNKLGGGNSSGKRGEAGNRMRRGGAMGNAMKGGAIVGGHVAVHVAS